MCIRNWKKDKERRRESFEPHRAPPSLQERRRDEAIMARDVAADNAAVVARLTTALADPDLAALTVPITLLSERDGTKTPAVAFLLAGCSSVFRGLLLDGFAEDTGPVGKRSRTSYKSCGSGAGGGRVPSPEVARTVRCAFSGEALAAFVEFSAKNDACALREGSVAVLDELFKLFMYYRIQGLDVKVMEQMFARMRENPENACQVLEFAWEPWSAVEFKVGGIGRLAHGALEAIEKSPHVALAKIGCVSEGAMEKVLRLKCLDASEEDMFNALQRWRSYSSEDNRTGGAQRLIGCLSLKKMSPSFLKNVVAKCDFVSKDALYDAFMFLSLQAEASQSGISQGKCLTSPVRANRPLPNWCRSGCPELTFEGASYATECLDLKLVSGRWSWDIHFEGLGGSESGGYVGLRFFDHNSAVQLTIGNFVAYYGSERGDVSPSELSLKGPAIFGGDSVRVLVDFNTGSLTLSVNGCKPFKPFGKVAWPVGTFARPLVGLTHGCARIVKFSEEKAGT